MNLNDKPLSFQHVLPELRVYCGEDSTAALIRELKRLGCQRSVVVSGKTVSRSDAMARLRETLGGLLVGESHAVRTNSPVAAVEEVTNALREFSADAVIAVGGGSAAVTGRAASILLGEGKSAQELCTRRQPDGEFNTPRLTAAKLPQFVVPTTPSTAFVKAGSAVYDVGTGERLALFDPKTRAKALFIHPEFLRTSPPELTRSASLNTLSTAVEALESAACDPLSEAMLMHSLRLIVRCLGDLAPENTSMRERLAVAGVLCGRGTEGAGGGLSSVLAHAIGHRVHVANGIVNAIVLPHTIRFNTPATLQTIERIVDSVATSQASGAGRAKDAGYAAGLLDSLFAKQGLPRRLREIGVAQDDLDAIADAAMGDWFINRAPRRVSSAADLREILQLAW